MWDLFGYRRLIKEIKIMATDVSKLQAVVDALKVKVAESVDTLKGLAQAVVDLKAEVAAGGDVQVAVDAVAAEAQDVLDSLSAAEDAADDQLPPPPVV